MKSAFVLAAAIVLSVSGCSAMASEVVDSTTLAGGSGSASSTAPANSRPATVTPTSTPTSTPTATQAAAAELEPPARIYSGTATCANLLDRSRLADYLAHDSVVTGDAYERKIVTEAAENSFPLGLATFVTYGGIACGWGDGYENRIIFGYGPISATRAADAKAYLLKHHLKKAKNSSFERYNGQSADWAFGNGYWAYAGDNGGGNVLSEVVANAPHWLHPANDTEPAPTTLTTRVATPAAAPYLSTDGLGALRLGAAIPADNPFVAFSAKTCFAAWLAKAPYGDARTATQALDVLTVKHTREARLTGIILRTAAIPTKSGIRVGDSLDTLTAAIPHFDETVPFDESTGYVVSDENGKVVFDVANANSPTGSYLRGQIRAISLFPASATGTDLNADNWAPCTV